MSLDHVSGHRHERALRQRSAHRAAVTKRYDLYGDRRARSEADPYGGQQLRCRPVGACDTVQIPDPRSEAQMTIYFHGADEIPYGCFSNFSGHGFNLDGSWWTTS